MERFLLKSKIHRAIVTDANLEYEGSLTIDSTLMEAANVCEFERVVIWNVTNGSRIETYAICGKADSGIICANGAAAHHVSRGDRIIIATFASYNEAEVASHRPIRVFVSSENQIQKKD